MSKQAEDGWTTYDIQTGRVVPNKRNAIVSKRLLEEAEKEANRLFNKFIKKGVYKEDEFDKFCIEYYLEGKHYESSRTSSFESLSR